jgi:hypothetical protein
MATRKKSKKKPVKGVDVCLAPGCTNLPQSRGLCWSDLATAKADIKAGVETEESLIEAGFMLPPKRIGRPRSTHLAKALAKKRA